MSERSLRRYRRVMKTLQQDRKETARDLIKELENAPFKYRFLFAMKLIFHRKK